MLIDTHAHIYKEYYENIDDIITEATTNGIQYIFNAGINFETNKEILETSERYNNVYISLGIHPECVNDYKLEDLLHIENNLSHTKVIAIGEIGLDYHYENYNKEKQIELFIKQLEMAQKYNFPVIIHSREATNDTLNILKKYRLKGIIHSFSGSMETAKEYIKLGYKLGINGVVTFKNAHIKEVIRELGIENFVLETDSPYLTPVPYRGNKNYPTHIKTIAEFLSEYLNIGIEDISLITERNIRSIFDKFLE